VVLGTLVRLVPLQGVFRFRVHELIVRCLRKTLSSTPLADTLNRTSTCLSLLDVYAGVSNDLLISSPMLVDPKNRVFTAVTTAQKLYGSGYKVDDASDELAT